MCQRVHCDPTLVTKQIHDPMTAFRDQKIRLYLGIAWLNRGLLGEVATGVLHGILLVLTVQGRTHAHYPMIEGAETRRFALPLDMIEINNNMKRNKSKEVRGIELSILFNKPFRLSVGLAFRSDCLSLRHQRTAYCEIGLADSAEQAYQTAEALVPRSSVRSAGVWLLTGAHESVACAVIRNRLILFARSFHVDLRLRHRRSEEHTSELQSP